MSKQLVLGASVSKAPAEVPARPPSAAARRESIPLLGLQRDLGNQAMLRLLESGLIQTKLRFSQPGDADEQEADRVADQVVSARHKPILQRKCACSGGASCSKCASEQEDDLIHRSVASPALRSLPLSVQRAPADATATIAPGAAPPTPAAASPQAPGMHRPQLIVEDDAPSLAPGQMKKSAFFDLLQADICATADAELAAVGRSTKSCPYIEKWLAFYRDQSGAHIEQALLKYAPEAAGATSARDYIVRVRERVRKAVATWAKTGQVAGVPAGVGLLPAAAPAVATGKGEGGGAAAAPSATGTGAVQFKERDGAATPTADAATVRAQLGHGRALDAGISGQMGAAFGHDFSSVRVHDDAPASTLSSQLNARAFTIGSDVAFASGEYQPGTPIGDALIAHELAHVVQQGGGKASSTVQAKEFSANDDRSLEQEADRSALGAVAFFWNTIHQGGLKPRPVLSPTLRSGLRLSRCKDDKAPASKVTCPTETVTMSNPKCGRSYGAVGKYCLPGAANWWFKESVKYAPGATCTRGAIIDETTNPIQSRDGCVQDDISNPNGPPSRVAPCSDTTIQTVYAGPTKDQVEQCTYHHDQIIQVTAAPDGKSGKVTTTTGGVPIDCDWTA